MVEKKSKKEKQLTKMIDTYIENNLDNNAFHTDIAIMFFSCVYFDMREQQKKIIVKLLQIAKKDALNPNTQFHEDDMFYRILKMLVDNAK